MRRNIFLFFFIIHQTVSIHHSLWKTSPYISKRPQNLARLDNIILPIDQILTNQNSHKRLHKDVYRIARTFHNQIPGANSPLGTLHLNQHPPVSSSSRHGKRPNESSMEKLQRLLNSYIVSPNKSITNGEDGTKKRNHLFGFWTNYLARN